MKTPYVPSRRFNYHLFMDYMTACGLSVSCVSLVAVIAVKMVF